MKVVIVSLLFLFTALLAVPGQTFQGNSTAVFVNPDGPEEAVYSGIGSSSIEYGEPLDEEDQASQVTFIGKSFAFELDERIPIGVLVYYNGITRTDTYLDGIDLDLSLELNQPVAVELNNQFRFSFDNTDNTSSLEASSDKINLQSPYGNGPVIVDGTQYSMRLFFGSVGDTAAGNEEDVLLLENEEVRIPVIMTLCLTQPLEDLQSGFTFESITGGEALEVAGEGTGSITTGIPFNESSEASGYTATGEELSGIRTETAFVAGIFRQKNGTVQTGTYAEAGILRVNLGGQLGGFDFPLRFISTGNSGTPREAADIVEIVNPVAERVVDIQGVTYGARIYFDNPTEGGYTHPRQFAVEEGITAEAEIKILISRFTPRPESFHIRTGRPHEGKIVMTVPAIPGETYRVELSVNLQSFIQNGSDIVATNPFIIVERGIPSSGSRFYRIRRMAEEEG